VTQLLLLIRLLLLLLLLSLMQGPLEVLMQWVWVDRLLLLAKVIM
jgi:hypothetical protein